MNDLSFISIAAHLLYYQLYTNRATHHTTPINIESFKKAGVSHLVVHATVLGNLVGSVIIISKNVEGVFRKHQDATAVEVRELIFTRASRI